MTPFKQRLREPKNLYGFFLGQPAPATVEMVGWSGFDFVVIDTEHGPAGLETLEHMLRAADSVGIAGIVRVASGSAADILHALDAGAAGILVPHITDAAAARNICDHAYYPPAGSRGISGITRAGRHGLAGPDYLTTQGTRTAVLAMLEDQEALSHAADIAAVPGLDAIFVGPADLAASMGRPGEPGHPDVTAAIESLWPAISGAGGAVAATTARSPADARRLAAAGVRMLCFNTTALLAAALGDLRRALDDLNLS